VTFVDQILRHTKDSESPRKYYYWSSLAAIAAAMKSNVYLDKFHYKLYPSIYVLLVGRSGLRKGPPVNLARKLVDSLNNTRVFAGRVSIEGVISNLSKAFTTPNGGPPITDASGFLVASEFASFIIQNNEALTILTDLYDRHYNDKWSYMLRNSPTENLKEPCLTLLGASNEVHIKDSIPDNAIGGGFIARTFIIYADKKATINPLTERPESLLPLVDLAQHLKDISRCKGEFTWSPGGKSLYNEWYQKFSDSDKSSEDSTGTMERLHDHILKTAMLISLSRKTDLRLEVPDIEEAIRACEDFIPGAKRVTLGSAGKSISAAGTAVLLRELLVNPAHEISRTSALQKHWAHFDSFELDRVAESLFAQKAITIQLRRDEKNANEQWYILNPKVLENYRKKNQKGEEE
jgi:hypothetical protein